MNKTEQFYKAIKEETSMILATAQGDSVTMRYVSPVYYGGDVLIFTEKKSLKYSQLSENPGCCIFAGGFFAEARAQFFGGVGLPENADMKAAYIAKFEGAFDGNDDYDPEAIDFILLRIKKIKGWGFKDDIVTEDGIPNEPFEIVL